MGVIARDLFIDIESIDDELDVRWSRSFRIGPARNIMTSLASRSFSAWRHCIIVRKWTPTIKLISAENAINSLLPSSVIWVVKTTGVWEVAICNAWRITDVDLCHDLLRIAMIYMMNARAHISHIHRDRSSTLETMELIPTGVCILPVVPHYR